MNNLQIAELFRNVASAYQFKDPGINKFKIIAYNRAADSVEHATSELKDLWDENKLDTVPGLGPSIIGHLDELFKTGKSSHFKELMKDIPSDAFKLMVLPKVGLKTAMKMIEELPKDELNKKINESEVLLNRSKRLLLPYAENLSKEVLNWIRECEKVENASVLGSLRRRSATIGDIDILVSYNDTLETEVANTIISHFVKYSKTQKIIEQGEHTSSILLPGNVQADLLVVPANIYGTALQHFTGSKFHNINLRELAIKNGYSLSEYGLKDIKTKKIKTFRKEEELYSFLNLDFIEPELREDTGEIQASLQHKLPNLVTIKDIKADLQIHSDFDIETSHDLGVNSMQEIVNKAKELKYEYIAFTEHNPSKSGHNEQEIINILIKKKKIVDHINYSRENNNPFVFNSLEIDINKDGTLPISTEALNTLDFALVSLHSVFDLPRDEMTNRVLKALSYPKVKIFAHPTGRKINEREGVELDWPRIFDFCLKYDKWLEINADPMRLDLSDTLVRDAVKAGVKLTLGTDTHEIGMMDNMRYGVDVARRGWCEKANIVNTLSLDEFKKLLI